ncbi:MAG TPA: DUF2759 family protein [Bacillales bacterium]
MALAFIFLVITIFAIVGAIRGFKNRNFFGGGFAVVTLLFFGWFSVMSLYAVFFGGGAVSGE